MSQKKFDIMTVGQLRNEFREQNLIVCRRKGGLMSDKKGYAGGVFQSINQR